MWMKQFSRVMSHDLQWENKKQAFGGWGWGEVSGVSFPLPRELGTKLKKVTWFYLGVGFSLGLRYQEKKKTGRRLWAVARITWMLLVWQAPRERHSHLKNKPKRTRNIRNTRPNTRLGERHLLIYTLKLATLLLFKAFRITTTKKERISPPLAVEREYHPLRIIN